MTRLHGQCSPCSQAGFEPSGGVGTPRSANGHGKGVVCDCPEGGGGGNIVAFARASPVQVPGRDQGPLPGGVNNAVEKASILQC